MQLRDLQSHMWVSYYDKPIIFVEIINIQQFYGIVMVKNLK